MKDNEILQQAMTLIDDELILDAKAPVKRKAYWVRWVAAAACLALIVGCFGYLGGADHKGSTSNTPNVSAPTPTPPLTNSKISDDLWQRDDFSAYSLSYGSSTSTLSAGSGGKITLLSEQTAPLQTQSITIDPGQTYKFEQLVAERYAVYLSESGSPVFYDTIEDQELDLQMRILGDTSHILARFKELAFAVAEQNYAEFMAAEENRNYLDQYLTCLANDTLAEKWEELTSFTPDIGFMDPMPEYCGNTQEQNLENFWNIPWNIYYHTLSDWQEETELHDAPYALSILGVDSTNGICIVRGNTLTGDGAFYGSYDIRTDTLQDLPDYHNSLIGIMQPFGFTFHFSADGSIATVAWPDCGYYFNYDIVNYKGDNLGAFFLDADKAYKFHVGFSEDTVKASSKLYVSDNNKVLYFRKMDETLANKSFKVSEEIWCNRLALFQKDTDIWAFYLPDENYNVGKPVELEGKFVRFAAEGSVVIMERGGSYYAYSLTDGSDITQDVISGTVATYAHEQLTVTLEEGKLYAANIFTGQRQTLGTADQYIQTPDGAFVFAYCQGDGHVTCYNVASGGSCQIQIDSALRDQLFSQENVVLQINYHPEENTLLISYYIPEDVPDQDTVDFYSLLAQVKPDDGSLGPDDPDVITDLQVTEDIIEQFRESAYRYDHPDGIIYWQNYYPAFISRCENRHSIFQCLGLTEPEDYLEMNGTKFILYEDEDEQLALVFWEYWPLYDYEDWDAGFHIEYTVSGKIYYYEFYVEGTQ